MKCPVCSGKHPGLVCQRCGFDSSRDYTKYPTFGPVGRVPAPSALEKEWNRQHVEEEAVTNPPPVKETRRRMPWFTLAACTVTLILGIAIGTGLGGGRPNPTEPPESIQLQTPAETTKPVETTEPEAIVQVHALRSDVPPLYGNGYVDINQEKTHAVFGSDYRREEIGSVRFLTTLTDAPADAWDVSQAGDGSVLAWVVPGGGLYDLHIGAEGAILAPENCQGLFAGYANVRSIEFGTEFRTDQVQNMQGMFHNCEALTNLTLSSFDTSKVTNMGSMFYGCSSLTELTLNGFDTSSVTDMGSMFSGCSSLPDLNLSSFNTSQVTNMYAMFSSCSSLTELTLSSFNTSNVTKMKAMFYGCSSLRNLDLSSFNTSNVTSTGLMFYDCPAGDDWQHLIH